MQSFVAMVVANLKMTVRNRQAIFWNLAFPAIFILMFGAVFGNGDLDQFTVGIAGGESEFRAAVIDSMRNTDAFDIHEGSTDEELAALKKDDRSVVLVFPEEGSDGAVEMYSSEASGPSGQIATGVTRSVVMEVAGQSSGISIEQKQISTLNASYIDWFIPGILGMSLMNSGIIGISTAFVSFREKGILRRIKVTPFALWKFILARIVAALVISLVTSGILIGIGWLIWDLTVRGNPLLVIAVLVVVSMAMLAIGYAIAAFARNTETAATYANMVTFPMMFLSGVFFPLGSMPDWLQPLISIMPLKYGVEALREPMLYGNGLGTIWQDLLILAAIFVAFMAFAIRFFKWDATAR
ncbi:MAG TPA: ABC transporter permease [Thermomicrobiales bacterium]|nr:ABC transporter permease [Thermomicrobiales bacterium]